MRSIPSEKSAVRTLERLKHCLHCGCDMHPPNLVLTAKVNLVLTGYGRFYVICNVCGLENSVYVVDDGS